MAVFDFETIHEKYDNANLVEKIVKNKVIYVKDITEASQYMIKHFFPLTTGEHLFLEDTSKNEAVILSDKSSSTYFKKIPDAVISWYLKDYLRLFKVINDIGKPFGPIDKQAFNVCNGLLHQTYKKFEEYPEHIKACVNKLLFHIKDVMCDGKEDSYIYIVKWIANMCRGNKNDSVLYLRSPEGTGKSIVFDFITDYVLGRKSCVKGTPEMLTNGFNSSLLGKLFVRFEELPTFNGSWSGIYCRLKDMITGETITIMFKNKDSFEVENLNNYIMTANEKSMKNASGRRIFEPDISTKRLKDYVYFGDIKKTCYNLEVGEAFYAYMMEQDLTNWNAQKDMPLTNRKIDEIVARLGSTYTFIKNQYVLRKRSMNITPSKLYGEFMDYCIANSIKTVKNTYFYQELKDVNIVRKKSGEDKYKYSAEILLKIATSLHWIHDTDEFIEEKKETKPNNNYNFVDENPLDNGIDKVIANNNEVEQLKRQIEALKKELEQVNKKTKLTIDEEYIMLMDEHKERLQSKKKKQSVIKKIKTTDEDETAIEFLGGLHKKNSTVLKFE